jgi:hypothetical protein
MYKPPPSGGFLVPLLDKIRYWYEGRTCAVSKDGSGRALPYKVRKYHWTAKSARWMVSNRKWFLPCFVALISALACAYVTFK